MGGVELDFVAGRVLQPGLRVGDNLMGSLRGLWDIVEVFGNLENFDVVEVGGGFGMLAFLILRAFDVASYTIVDLPEVLELQKRFLGELLPNAAKKLVFLPPELRQKRQLSYDLFISLTAFSELHTAVQKAYFEGIVIVSSLGYIVDNRVQGVNNRKRSGENVTKDHLRLNYSGFDLVEKLSSTGFLAQLLVGDLMFLPLGQADYCNPTTLSTSLIQRITFRAIF